MSDIKDGERRGRNSPVVTLGEYVSLRDWFAGMALQGLIAEFYQDGRYASVEPALAEKAYFLADALISFRSARGGE